MFPFDQIPSSIDQKYFVLKSVSPVVINRVLSVTSYCRSERPSLRLLFVDSFFPMNGETSSSSARSVLFPIWTFRGRYYVKGNTTAKIDTTISESAGSITNPRRTLFSSQHNNKHSTQPATLSFNYSTSRTYSWWGVYNKFLWLQVVVITCLSQCELYTLHIL